jgi:hypothetical protein
VKSPAFRIAAAALAFAAGSALAQGYGYGPRAALDLYAAKADAGAIAGQQKKVDALREQMSRQRTEMRREMDAALARQGD